MDAQLISINGNEHLLQIVYQRFSLWFGLVVLTVIVKELIVIIVGAKEHTTTVTPRQNKRSKLIE